VAGKYQVKAESKGFFFVVAVTHDILTQIAALCIRHIHRGNLTKS